MELLTRWPEKILRNRRLLERRVPVVLAAFGLLMALFAVVGRGVYMDDDVLHLQIARSCVVDPLLLLDEWGRPGFTIPYAVVGFVKDSENAFLLGRFLSVILTLATAWLTYRAAKMLSLPTAWAAPVLLLAMPLYFGVSHTTTTETIAAFHVACGTYLILCGRWKTAALVLALLPITRHEMIALTGGLFVFMLIRRQYVAALLTGWAELAWNVAVVLIGKEQFFKHEISDTAKYWLGWLPPQLPIARFYTPQPIGALGEGTWTHYIDRWLQLSGTPVVWFACLGMIIIAIRLFARWGVWRSLVRPNPRRDLWIVMTGGVVGVLVMFTVLYAFNRFASGGYARFLIPVAPWMACLAALGLFAFCRAFVQPTFATTDRMRYLIVIAVMMPMMFGSTTIKLLIAYHWVVALLTLAVVVIGTRSARNAWAGVLVVLAVGELCWEGRPHLRTVEQNKIREVVHSLKQRYPGVTIHGTNPWVEFYANEPIWRHSLPDPWTDRDPTEMLIVYELIHGKPQMLARLLGEEDPTWKSPLIEEHRVPYGLYRDKPFIRVFQRPTPTTRPGA